MDGFFELKLPDGSCYAIRIDKIISVSVIKGFKVYYLDFGLDNGECISLEYDNIESALDIYNEFFGGDKNESN